VIADFLGKNHSGVKLHLEFHRQINRTKMKLLNIFNGLKKINILDIILVLFAVLFVYAAVSKLLTYDEFKAQISKSPLIARHEWWIAWVIPISEILIAVMLFIPRIQIIGLYSAFSLMFIFTIYIGFMLAFTPNLPCSCGGILNKMGWKEHLFFNIGFTILSIVGIVLFNRQRKIELIGILNNVK
jgi:uncharacterized membrane protein YphA (DoxX/SURF4 family)